MAIQKDKIQSPTLLWLSLIAVSLMWGSIFLFIKISVVEVPPFALTAVRAGIAAVALTAMLVLFQQPVRLSRSQFIHMVVLGTVNGWLPDVLTAFAVLRIDSAKAGMLSASTPLFTVLLAHLLIEEERLHWRKTIGILVGFTGIFLLVGPDKIIQGSGSISGYLLMLAVALCYATGNVYGRWVRASNPAQLALGQIICTCIPAAVISFAIEPRWSLDLTPSVLFSILVLGILCTAASNVLYLNLLRWLPATNVSTVSYLKPVWAATLGLLVLHETLSVYSVVGCAVVLLGVWIVNSARARTATG